jgi:hypothetical protein
VLARLLAAPFTLDGPDPQARRRVGLGKILRWLEQHPGQTWQDRWLVSGADPRAAVADLDMMDATHRGSAAGADRHFPMPACSAAASAV